MKTFKLRRLAASVALVCVCNGSRPAAQEIDFRTDINPALLYFQAFLTPQLTEADVEYLFASPQVWSAHPLDDRRLALLKQYDAAFKLLRRARVSHVPCDWGYDLSDGPEALLPGLAPVKRLAQAMRLRAMAALDRNDFDRFHEEMAAAFTLSRNVARDHILISCMVQLASENLLTSIVAENYYRLPADELDRLISAFDAAPARGTIAETIGETEREAFFGYILRKVTAIIAEAKGDEAAFWQRFETFWNPLATEVGSTTPDPSAAAIKEAAGGKPAEVLRLLQEMPDLYTETARVLALPYPEYKQQAAALFTAIGDSPNPFVKQFFTIFKNIRAREFSTVVRYAMLRAAAAYKRGGPTAFETVEDPLIGGPFEFTRVQFEGVDRGFRLRSKEQFREFDEVLIFLEKPGTPFRLEGKNAGTAR